MNERDNQISEERRKRLLEQNHHRIQTNPYVDRDEPENKTPELGLSGGIFLIIFFLIIGGGIYGIIYVIGNLGDITKEASKNVDKTITTAVNTVSNPVVAMKKPKIKQILMNEMKTKTGKEPKNITVIHKTGNEFVAVIEFESEKVKLSVTYDNENLLYRVTF